MKNSKTLKKIIAAVMAITIFTSCGTNKTDNKENNSKNKTEQAEGNDKGADSTEEEANPGEEKGEQVKEEDKVVSEEPKEVEKTPEEIAADELKAKEETLKYVNGVRTEKKDKFMDKINKDRNEEVESLYADMKVEYINKELDKTYNSELAKFETTESKLIQDIETKYANKAEVINKNNEIELKKIEDEYEVVTDAILQNYNAKKEKIDKEYEVSQGSLSSKKDIENNNDPQDEDGFDYDFHYYDDEKPENTGSGETAVGNEELKGLKTEKEEKLLEVQKEKIDEEFAAKEDKNNKERDANKSKISELATLESEKLSEIDKIKNQFLEKKKNLLNSTESKKTLGKSIINEYELALGKETETRDKKINDLAKVVIDNYDKKIEQISNFEDKDSPSWEPILNKEVTELEEIYSENDKKASKAMDSQRFVYKSKVENLLK